MLERLWQATAFDFGGLVAARIGLGTFEAGFSPVAVLYLSKPSVYRPLLLGDEHYLPQAFSTRRTRLACEWHTGSAFQPLRVLSVVLSRSVSSKYTRLSQIGGYSLLLRLHINLCQISLYSLLFRILLSGNSISFVGSGMFLFPSGSSRVDNIPH